MKKTFTVFALLCLIISVTACNTKEKNIKKGSAKEVTNETKTEVKWPGLYLEKVNEIIENNPLNESEETMVSDKWDSISYILPDINQDGTPELVIEYSGKCSGCEGTEFYTVDNDKVVSLGEGAHGSIYKNKKNYYIEYFGHGWTMLDELTIKDNKIDSKSLVSTEELDDSEIDKYLEKASSFEFKDLRVFEAYEVNNQRNTKEKDYEKVLGTYYDTTDGFNKKDYFELYNNGTFLKLSNGCEYTEIFCGTYEVKK